MMERCTSRNISMKTDQMKQILLILKLAFWLRHPSSQVAPVTRVIGLSPGGARVSRPCPDDVTRFVVFPVISSGISITASSVSFNVNTKISPQSDWRREPSHLFQSLILQLPGEILATHYLSACPWAVLTSDASSQIEHYFVTKFPFHSNSMWHVGVLRFQLSWQPWRVESDLLQNTCSLLHVKRRTNTISYLDKVTVA